MKLKEIKHKSKDKEKRLKEKEKVDTETQRTSDIAETKKVHKINEDTEKSRKFPAIKSICQRINDSEKLFSLLVDMFSKHPARINSLVEDVKYDLRENWQIYESIRIDFQETLDFKEEDMEKFFPRLEINMETGYWVNACIRRVLNQLRLMKLYCERKLV
ncbi:MAG: hypothetical protein QG670_1561 [Thermoproteota archaeon]|nr:hypothetical protein [Thermoproteota archaeon]